MQLKIKSLSKTHIKYYQHGLKPRLLILTGLHGDELVVIDGVQKAVETYLHQLPAFLFIPQASPSAVRQRTRINKDQVDINRQFSDSTKIDEVKLVMNIIKPHHFKLALSFHEDLDQTCFYFYLGGHYNQNQIIHSFKQEIQKSGVQLFNGIDDADDPALGHKVSDGYCPLEYLQDKKTANGTFDAWLLKKGIAQCIITPEIPGQIDNYLKYQIIDALFRHFVLNSFSFTALQLYSFTAISLCFLNILFLQKMLIAF